MTPTRRRPGGWPLGGPLVSTFAACLVAVLVVGIVGTALAFRGWNDRLADRREYALSAMAAAELRQTYTAGNAALLAFLAGGAAEDLARHRQHLADAGAQLDALDVRLAGQDESAPLLVEVRDAAARWEAAVAGLGTADAELPVEAGVAAESLDESLDRLVTAQTAHFADAVDLAGDAGQDTATVLAVTFGLVALLCGLGVVVARRWLTTPMRRLRDQVMENTHESTITAEGPLELQEIATAINRMRADLLAERDRARRARDAIEQSAVLAAQVGAQLGGVLGSFPPGWSAAAELRPAAGVVAGDTYAVKLIGPHSIGVLLLDIVGHGAEPAIIALRCREVILAGLRHRLDPGAALEGLKAHDHGLDHGNFLTAFLAVIDTATGRCRYANAGHPPALLVDGETVTALGQTGPVFGPFPDRTWGTRDVDIPPGAGLVVYSDGLIEARKGGEFYGLERLTECVLAVGGDEERGVPPDAGRLMTTIFDDLDVFGEAVRRDDQSVVVVSHVGPSDDEPDELVERRTLFRYEDRPPLRRPASSHRTARP